MMPWTMCMGSPLLMMCQPETGNWKGTVFELIFLGCLFMESFRNGGQWLLGKAMKAFAPIGPAIVTKDVIGDPNSLDLSCKVNGEVKQV